MPEMITLPTIVIGRYTGAAAPFGPDPAGTFGPKNDITVVLASIANILSTPKGSVPHDPFLGSFVANMLFEQEDDITRNLIRYYTIKDITDQEPRAQVLAVYTRELDPHSVQVSIALQLVGDASGRIYNAPITFQDRLAA